MLCKTKSFFLIGFLLGFFVLAGCDQLKGVFQTTATPKVEPASSSSSVSPSTEPGASAQGTVLAKVNNEVITLESFYEKTKALESLSPDLKIKTLEAKKNYLNDLIIQELIYQEAKSRGIDRKKEVKDAIEEFRKGVMARQLILDETKGITIEPAEIESFYNQYKQQFAAPAEIKASEIVVSSESAAKEILISLLQGGDFGALAKEKSIAASASKGGNLGWVKKEDKFDKFHEVISTLEAGQVSQVFKGPDGHYVVKVDEKKGGGIPEYTDVYEQIKKGLLQQNQARRIQDLSDKLRKDAKIEIKEELLR